MMFELFTLLIILAVVFFLAGFQYENYPTFSVSGLIFVMLALGIFTTGLTIQTGTEQTYIYGANFSDYHWDYYGDDPVVDVKDYELFHVEETKIYESSEGLANNTLGMFLLAMSIFAFGCALIYATPKKDRDENDPDKEEWNYY